MDSGIEPGRDDDEFRRKHLECRNHHPVEHRLISPVTGSRRQGNIEIEALACPGTALVHAAAVQWK